MLNRVGINSSTATWQDNHPPLYAPGTVTFLLIDIEGGAKRWEQYPGVVQVAIALQNSLLTYGASRWASTGTSLHDLRVD